MQADSIYWTTVGILGDKYVDQQWNIPIIILVNHTLQPEPAVSIKAIVRRKILQCVPCQRWHLWVNSRWAARKTPAIFFFFFFSFFKHNSTDFESLLLRHKASACLRPCLFWAKDKNILLESHLEVEAAWSWLYSIPITGVLWPPP